MVKAIADLDKDDTFSGGVWTDLNAADDQTTTYTYADAYDSGLVTKVQLPDSADSSWWHETVSGLFV